MSASNQGRVARIRWLQESRTSSWRVAFSALLVASVVSLKAVAAEPTLQARESYAEGARAYDAQDYASAAARFAHADELSPNLIALRLALISATRADDATLVMTLVRRAQGRQLDDETRNLVGAAQQRFSHRVALVRVHCRTEACHARVAGRSTRDGELTVVLPGEVMVEFGQGANIQARLVEVAPEQTVDVLEPAKPLMTPPLLRIEVPAAKPQQLPVLRATPAAVQPVSLPRGFFWGGVALTGALGAATAFSGIDTLSKRERFEKNRNIETRASAQSAVERTNWLLGSVLVSGTVTAVLGVFFTDTARPRTASVPAF